MLELEEIKKNFPKEVHSENKAMLREYLQVKILELIFKSKIASKLTFIGGTALRIVYKTKRFSEDLDFDNKDLSMDDWKNLAELILTEINKQGFKIEIKRTRLNEDVFHHNICFPELLFSYGLSPHKNQNLIIKADSQNQGIEYDAEIFNLNYFDVNTKIKVMPRNVALSQKFRAFFDREMGRDLFDISSIAPTTKPCYNYLEQALGISNSKQLKERVLARCEELDILALVNRAKPFLFKEEDVNRILYFKDYMKQYEF